jgi:fused signal recognition particle receptor
VFDAMTAAQSRKADVLIIDTAGRLHTKKNLMEELKKVHRVIDRKLSGAPHEVWLVLDATTGQNAISQAEMFHQALGVTDIILTKLDGTAKGGIVVGISEQLKIPIKYIGIGEKMDDLTSFDPEEFVSAIFE